MKEGTLIGMVIGLFVGALLFKHCDAAQDIINKGEIAVKKELNEMAKQIDKKTGK